MYTLGVNVSHDSSIALLKNNQVVLFVCEERVNGKKHFQGIPLNALDLIKNYTKTIDMVSMIGASRIQSDEILNVLKIQDVKVRSCVHDNLKHHLAHGASAFYQSGFDEACVIVIDGAGAITWLGKQNGQTIKANETTSIYNTLFPDTFNCVYKKCVAGYYNNVDFNLDDSMLAKLRSQHKIQNIELTKTHDIGWQYYQVTKSIGFGATGEGKTMGLSGYGSDANASKEAQLAYKLQKDFTAQLIKVVEKALRKTKTRNVVFGGGCALNILGNSAVKKHFDDINLFIDPIASDASIALGGAGYLYYLTTKNKEKLLFNCYSGPEYKLQKDSIHESARKYSV